MAVRPILRMGDPKLLRASEPVTEFNSPELLALLLDMEETMAAHGGVGLAATQIGVELQVVIFGMDQNPRYPEADPVPHTVLINPRLAYLGDEMEEGWEGCLSLPGLRGLVPRQKHLRYTGLDQSGRPIERTVDGFHARVVQHECDHLMGILYPMRMRDLSKFGFTDTLFPDQMPPEE